MWNRRGDEDGSAAGNVRQVCSSCFGTCGTGKRGRQSPTQDRRPDEAGLLASLDRCGRPGAEPAHGRPLVNRAQKPTTPEGVPTGEQRRKHNHRTAARTGDGDACRRQEEGRTQEEGRSQGRAEEGCCRKTVGRKKAAGRKAAPKKAGRKAVPRRRLARRRPARKRRPVGRRPHQEEGRAKGRRTQEGCGSSGSGSGIHAEWP